MNARETRAPGLDQSQDQNSDDWEKKEDLVSDPGARACMGALL
jgi:hypothetical protein